MQCCSSLQVFRSVSIATCTSWGWDKGQSRGLRGVVKHLSPGSPRHSQNWVEEAAREATVKQQRLLTSPRADRHLLSEFIMPTITFTLGLGYLSWFRGRRGKIPFDFNIKRFFFSEFIQSNWIHSSYSGVWKNAKTREISEAKFISGFWWGMCR